VSSSVDADDAFGPKNQGLPSEEIRRLVGTSLAASGPRLGRTLSRS
jgi:energy-coupling factor transporter ATP-binding protein EcfA2